MTDEQKQERHGADHAADRNGKISLEGIIRRDCPLDQTIVVVGLVTCKPDRPRRRVSGEGCGDRSCRGQVK
jgi:hypothetical protein